MSATASHSHRSGPRLACALLALALATLAGCRSVYYGTLDTFGVQKRDILVTKVVKARESQDEARQQFKDTWQSLRDLSGNQSGGELEERYKLLRKELGRSEARTREVGRRIHTIEKVGAQLFEEWEGELEQYTDASLRADSRRQLVQTRERFQAMVTSLRQSESKMGPVLQAFEDQVLYLKHNLNARAVASLQPASLQLQRDIGELLQQMDRSISEVDRFIQGMGNP